MTNAVVPHCTLTVTVEDVTPGRGVVGVCGGREGTGVAIVGVEAIVVVSGTVVVTAADGDAETVLGTLGSIAVLRAQAGTSTRDKSAETAKPAGCLSRFITRCLGLFAEASQVSRKRPANREVALVRPPHQSL